MRNNLILDTDSYKTDHYLQYPPGTNRLFAYLEARVGGEYPAVMFFGLQGLLKEYLSKPITMEDVLEAEKFITKHVGPFPLDGWRRVVEKHGGYLPLRIRSIPEGMVVPAGTPLVTVESTDPELAWLVGWFETKLVRLWYPCTVATRSFYCKKVIHEFLEATADRPLEELGFKLHDFGSRGVSSRESAGIGGAAHLLNFMGTDTIEGIRYAQEFYNEENMLGFSIPAMEHSTVISWGKDGEEAAFANMLNAPQGMVACVSDSYDLHQAVEKYWAGSLRDQVKASGKVVVIRPDSGDPVLINLDILRILEKKVGMTVNAKGYKVLPSYYRIIQGDGNKNENDIRRILQALKDNGYSASNLSFGMGGGLLQFLNRDTLRFAYKVSEIQVGTETRGVQKMPKTDPSKASKMGRLDVIETSHFQFKTVVISLEDIKDPLMFDLPRPDSVMGTAYLDGRIFEENFSDLRALAQESFWDFKG